MLTPPKVPRLPVSGPSAIPPACPLKQFVVTRTCSTLIVHSLLHPIVPQSPPPLAFSTVMMSFPSLNFLLFFSYASVLNPRVPGIGVLRSFGFLWAFGALIFWWPSGILNCFLTTAPAWCCYDIRPSLHLLLLQPILPMIKTRTRKKTIWETLLMLIQGMWSLPY